jgi:hypothetical protein
MIGRSRIALSLMPSLALVGIIAVLVPTSAYACVHLGQSPNTLLPSWDSKGAWASILTSVAVATVGFWVAGRTRTRKLFALTVVGLSAGCFALTYQSSCGGTVEEARYTIVGTLFIVGVTQLIFAGIKLGVERTLGSRPNEEAPGA